MDETHETGQAQSLCFNVSSSPFLLSLLVFFNVFNLNVKDQMILCLRGCACSPGRLYACLLSASHISSRHWVQLLLLIFNYQYLQIIQ